ncbi:hypothetical protein MKCMC460_59770 (plasmid) [Mycobacterium sp. 20KCMC460]|nr:hypothetical protein MKCMC460_59770 [Mycobacterium sp. 20KCMC460]GLB93216.1 hypothetical protein SRL2020130_60330 [Mycobacterium kiyosense]GLB99182.1 hypothetical protein SRL2020226_59580 [Mycobacterium kiyosense]GLC04811.1 hypothetical protein SRL2020400_54020 [Mycobacterium kiyosense]GLD08858.1 hypothetical protein Mkiyose1383_51840 [Mycobacterium kiyosense]
MQLTHYVTGVVFDRVSDRQHADYLVVAADEYRCAALLFEFGGGRSEIFGEVNSQAGSKSKPDPLTVPAPRPAEFANAA